MSSADWGDRVAVVGGGISAVQAALRLVDAGKEVSLVARHALRVHQFDSDPGWVGPKNMRRFQATRDVDQRRALITEARHAGSVPPALRRRVSHAIQAGKIRWMQGDVSVAASDPLQMFIGESRVAADGILLATGFEAVRPGGSFIDELVEKHGLPCASCGFPVVDAHLRWHPRVFVTGPLAELEIGPVARNIVGARRAAERILPFLAKAG